MSLPPRKRRKVAPADATTSTTAASKSWNTLSPDLHALVMSFSEMKEHFRFATTCKNAAAGRFRRCAFPPLVDVGGAGLFHQTNRMRRLMQNAPDILFSSRQCVSLATFTSTDIHADRIGAVAARSENVKDFSLARFTKLRKFEIHILDLRTMRANEWTGLSGIAELGLVFDALAGDSSFDGYASLLPSHREHIIDGFSVMGKALRDIGSVSIEITGRTLDVWWLNYLVCALKRIAPKRVGVLLQGVPLRTPEVNDLLCIPNLKSVKLADAEIFLHSSLSKLPNLCIDGQVVHPKSCRYLADSDCQSLRVALRDDFLPNDPDLSAICTRMPRLEQLQLEPTFVGELSNFQWSNSTRACALHTFKIGNLGRIRCEQVLTLPPSLRCLDFKLEVEFWAVSRAFAQFTSLEELSLRFAHNKKKQLAIAFDVSDLKSPALTTLQIACLASKFLTGALHNLQSAPSSMRRLSIGRFTVKGCSIGNIVDAMPLLSDLELMPYTRGIDCKDCRPLNKLHLLKELTIRGEHLSHSSFRSQFDGSGCRNLRSLFVYEDYSLEQKMWSDRGVSLFKDFDDDSGVGSRDIVETTDNDASSNYVSSGESDDDDE